MSDEKPTNNTTAPPTGGESIPRYRFNEVAEKGRSAIAARDEALAKVAELEAKLATATSGLKELQTSSAQNVHLLGMGFKEDSVRRFFRREYAAVAKEAGDAAPAFSDWLETNKSDPLYSPHFERLKPAKTAQTADEEPAGGSTSGGGDDSLESLLSAMRAALNGSPEGGTSQPARGRAKELTVEEIRRTRAKNGGKLGAEKESMIAALRAKGLIQ